MQYLRNLLTFGFALTLAGVWPAISEGQTLSFVKTLPGSPEGVSAATGDASGIYVASGTDHGTFVRKYDRDGVEIWSRGFGVPVTLTGMTTSGAGVYAAGFTFPGSVDAFVRLYDVQGNEIWTSQFGLGSRGTFVRAVAVDASGVYVAGDHYSGQAGEGYLRKYNHRGAELWTKRFEYASAQMAAAADATGVYLGGNAAGRGFIRKYDAGGTEIWARTLYSLGGITANATGVYVLGWSLGTGILRRYDSSGNQIWSRSGIAGWGHRIESDADGVYLAGATTRALTGQCALGAGDAFVERYDTDGKQLWTRQFGTYRWEFLNGIAAHADSLFAAGIQQGPDGSRAFLAKLEKASVAAAPSETRIRNECVVNAASYVGGAVTPGEIVTIFGTAIGPTQPVSATITEDRPLDTTLAETRVLFGGVPAPLLYVSSRQSTAIVPNAVASKSSVGIQVEYRGVLSNAITLPVLKAHPGILSLNSSGEGQAAILNEDGTWNSPANPARRGSIVVIFGTGGGETNPVTAEGQVVASPPPRLKTSVLVAFTDPELGCDGYLGDAEASYAGGVVGFVAGLLQVNVRVPESVPAGNWFPQLVVGGWPAEAPSPQSVRIAVR